MCYSLKDEKHLVRVSFLVSKIIAGRIFCTLRAWKMFQPELNLMALIIVK